MRLGCRAALSIVFLNGALAADVYFNDFNGPLGTAYPEWSSTGYTNTANTAGTIGKGAGPQPITNVDSANGKQRFLGEFGGPAIVTSPPYDPAHFVRVDETVTLTLKNLKPHSLGVVSFDLYVLESWDGNNPNYGPDRWSLAVEGGPTLLDTSFSNNFKTDAYDLSSQDYPVSNSPPQTSAAAVNGLGYSFYGDSIYRLSFTFTHGSDTLILHFSSSLFEGKGTGDESWGLDNVRVSTNADAPLAVSAAASAVGLAPESLASIYGGNLAQATQTAMDQPLPFHLGGVSVVITDTAHTARLAPLLYVSPNQINFEVPSGTHAGDGPFIVQSDSGSMQTGTIHVQQTAPALFSANGDGRGVIAATAIRTRIGSDEHTPVPVFQCGSMPLSCVSVPIDLGTDTPVYVSLYGSGIRGRASDSAVSVSIGGTLAPVFYSGAQGTFAGLDQVNIGLPLSLRGSGEMDIVLSVNGQQSNSTRIGIR